MTGNDAAVALRERESRITMLLTLADALADSVVRSESRRIIEGKTREYRRFRYEAARPEVDAADQRAEKPPRWTWSGPSTADSPGEETCFRCGGPNLLCWHAPSPLWNAVMRDADGRDTYGVVCPRCFGEMAKEAGVAWSFCVTTHDPKVELAQVFTDGRVWNAEKCLWVEAEDAADQRVGLDRLAVERLHQMIGYEGEGIPAWTHKPPPESRVPPFLAFSVRDVHDAIVRWYARLADDQ